LAALAPVPEAPEDDGLAAAAADEDVGFADADVTRAGLVAGVGVTNAVVVVAPLTGALEAALIWAWTSGENVPVMPVMANFAENARAGAVGVVGSLRLIDSNRIKYWLLLGPMVGSGVNWIEPAVDTSRLGVMAWRSVCCWALPT